MLEGQHVPFQKRFLRLRRERDVKRPPRMRQAHHEQPAGGEHPGDERRELPEVDLGLGAGQMGLGHHHLHPV
jgi:hypothetical protein